MENWISLLFNISWALGIVANIWWMISVFSISIFFGLLFYVFSWLVPLLVIVASRGMENPSYAVVFAVLFPTVCSLLLIVFSLVNWRKLWAPFVMGLLSTLLFLGTYVSNHEALTGQKFSYNALASNAIARLRQPGVTEKKTKTVMTSANAGGLRIAKTETVSGSGGEPNIGLRFDSGSQAAIKTTTAVTEKDLIKAVQNGSLAEVELLLSTGLDVNTRNVFGNTLLMEAASYGYLDIVKVLLRFGADPALKSPSGETALEMARVNGRLEIAKLLDS